jgi:hypothetical protein
MSRTTTRGGKQKSPDEVTSTERMEPKSDEVLIRMYGQGVGDCFLLAFPPAHDSESQRPVYVVIDCGVIPQTPGGSKRMKAIVEEIRKTTRDDDLGTNNGDEQGHIDLLVITHEHMDHVSGFLQAQDEWNKIHVDEIWMAWTEREDDRLPDALRILRDKQRKALLEATGRARRFGLDDLRSSLVSRLAFEGDVDEGSMGFDFSVDTAKALEVAKKLEPGKKVYCEPGDVHIVPGTDSVAYVLGPPRNQEFLNHPDPTPSDPETYESDAGDAPAEGAGANAVRRLAERSALGSGLALKNMAYERSPFNAFALPLVHNADGSTRLPASTEPVDPLLDDEGLYYRSFPFGAQQRVPVTSAEAVAGSSPDLYPGFDSYYREDNDWRRVDFDWLISAEAFALQLGDLTNNSSLVLAFELPSTHERGKGKVLLFVADAMVGNWLSWNTIEDWRPQRGARTSQSKPDIDELLGRAVFYKVGHHGSHNATLKKLGLERMPSTGLTAFAPVNPRVARDIKNWCEMPLDVLMDALSQRTEGRVVLSNGNTWPPVDDPDALAAKLQDLKVTTSKRTLPAMKRSKTNVEIEAAHPIWVQIAVEY